MHSVQAAGASGIAVKACPREVVAEDLFADSKAARNRAIAEPAREMGLYVAPANVFVRVRGDSVRVTPHRYNDDDDIERFFGAVEMFI